MMSSVVSVGLPVSVLSRPPEVNRQRRYFGNRHRSGLFTGIDSTGSPHIVLNVQRMSELLHIQQHSITP